MKLFLQLIIVSSVVVTSASGMIESELRNRKTGKVVSSSNGQTQKPQESDTDVEIRDIGDEKSAKVEHDFGQDKWKVSVDTKVLEEEGEKLQAAVRDADEKGAYQAFFNGADPNGFDDRRTRKGRSNPTWEALQNVFWQNKQESYNKFKRIFFMLCSHPEVNLDIRLDMDSDRRCPGSKDAIDWNDGKYLPLLHYAAQECDCEYAREDNFEIIRFLLEHPRYKKNSVAQISSCEYDYTILHFIVWLRSCSDISNEYRENLLKFFMLALKADEIDVNAQTIYGYQTRNIPIERYSVYQLARQFSDKKCEQAIAAHKDYKKPEPVGPAQSNSWWSFFS